MKHASPLPESPLRELIGNPPALTQRQIARLCSVTQQTVSNWYAGNTTPPASSLAIVRRALGRSESELAALEPMHAESVEAVGYFRAASRAATERVVAEVEQLVRHLKAFFAHEDELERLRRGR